MKCEECEEYGNVCVLTDSIGNRNIVSELEYHKNAAIHSIDEAIEHLMNLSSRADKRTQKKFGASHSGFDAHEWVAQWC